MSTPAGDGQAIITYLCLHNFITEIYEINKIRSIKIYGEYDKLVCKEMKRLYY